MRIGVNLRYLQKNITGVERATLELLKVLTRLPGDHSFIGYITDRPFVSDQTYRDLLSCPRLELRQAHLWHEDILSRLLWDLFGVGQHAKRDNVDLFWGPSFSLPFFLPCPGVVTIYDVAFLHLPLSYDRITRWFHQIVTPSSARRAQAILTISECSKNDIQTHMAVPEKRIHVIQLACSQQFRPTPQTGREQADVLQKYGIRSPFWLTVSQISPRKNLSHLVRVYASLLRERRVSQQLVLVGKNGWLFEDVYAVVRDEGVENDVVFTKAVSDPDLVVLYNAAELFLYPSLYEGFGLPVLEAMSCGVPVITSNTSSLPEVIGDAGVMLPPTDIQAWVDAICELSSNPESREILRKHGSKRAEQFNWERSAQSMLEIFRKVTLDGQ